MRWDTRRPLDPGLGHNPTSSRAPHAPSSHVWMSQGPRRPPGLPAARPSDSGAFPPGSGAAALGLIISNLLREDRCPCLIETSNFQSKLGLNFP